MTAPRYIPAKCTNVLCGYTFNAPNPLPVGGRYVSFQNNTTRCPKCRQVAVYSDWTLDGEGQFHLRGFFKKIREFHDPQKLRRIKESLEAANDDFSGEELADTLIEIDPVFEKFKKSLSSLSIARVNLLVSLIFNVIIICLMLESGKTQDSQHEESIALTRQQIEIQQEERKNAQEHRSKLESEVEGAKELLEKQLEIMQLQLQLQENIRDSGAYSQEQAEAQRRDISDKLSTIQNEIEKTLSNPAKDPNSER